MHPAVHQYMTCCSEVEMRPSADRTFSHAYTYACVVSLLLSLRLTFALTFTDYCITHKVISQKPPSFELFIQPPVVHFGKIAQGESWMPMRFMLFCHLSKFCLYFWFHKNRQWHRLLLSFLFLFYYNLEMLRVSNFYEKGSFMLSQVNTVFALSAV